MSENFSWRDEMSKSFVELSFLLFCVLTYIAILEFFLRRRNGVKFLDEKTVLLHVILIILSGILSAYQGIVIGFNFLSFSSLNTGTRTIRLAI